ncbi:MAG: hypothetical protein LVQ95_04185 [Candidatus Micrarchaeales archaeon]|nr:hypothetical protein [Candidatus Micrarchaeales archaeon]
MPAIPVNEDKSGSISKEAERKAVDLSQKLRAADSSDATRENLAFEVISALQEYPEEREALAVRIIGNVLESGKYDSGLVCAVAARIQSYFETILDGDAASGFSHSIEGIKPAPQEPGAIALRFAVEARSVGEAPVLDDGIRKMLDAELKANAIDMRKWIKEVIAIGGLNWDDLTDETFEGTWTKAFEKIDEENKPLWRIYSGAAQRKESEEDPNYAEALKTLEENGGKTRRLQKIKSDATASVMKIVSGVRKALRAESYFPNLDQKTRKELLEALRYIILYLKRYDGRDLRCSTFSEDVIRGMLDVNASDVVTDVRLAFYKNDPKMVADVIKPLLNQEQRGSGSA